MAVRWTRAARRDQRIIIEWLSDRNPAAAGQVLDRIERSLANLETMPRMGRAGRVAETRELVVPRTPYLVIYRVQDPEGEVIVVRLLHTAQRWPPKEP
jgi:toxin ParE1/3/4